MNCHRVRNLLKYNPASAGEFEYEIERHAQSCKSCAQELVISKLMNTLLRAEDSADNCDGSPWESTRLVNRIKSRIQEVGERSANSWDLAIIGVRGWLVAFGVTAILLLVLSTDLAKNNSGAHSTVSNLNRSVNLSEELVSSNSSPNLLPEEDSENAH